MSCERCKIIKDKYEEMKMLQHDINKYCSVVESFLLAEQREAIQITKSLKERATEIFISCYTDNRVLNMILSQKLKVCNENSILFNCYFENANFDFINRLDLISIFSNLIDNAIESCLVSKEKNIYLSSYLLNNTFVVIKIENSADLKPKINGDSLITLKNDKANHGFGIKSILKAIKVYDGDMQWEYDDQNNLFKTVIMF